jgi:hypothetical protein
VSGHRCSGGGAKIEGCHIINNPIVVNIHIHGDVKDNPGLIRQTVEVIRGIFGKRQETAQRIVTLSEEDVSRLLSTRCED